MPTAFSQTLRALDRGAASVARCWAGCPPWCCWAAGSWMGLAGVPVYEVSPLARLEVDRAVHPVAAPLAGRVVATHLTVDREVQACDVLVELDADAQQLQREEEHTWIAVRSTEQHGMDKAIPAFAGDHLQVGANHLLPRVSSL